MTKYLLSACLAVATGALASPVMAQTLNDRMWLEIDAYMPSIDTEIRVASKEHPHLATDIDLESDFDLDDSSAIPSVSAGYRFGNRWVIGADYYGLSRSANKMLSRDIDFDDVTFAASTNLSSRFDTDIYRLTIGYAFIRNEQMEVRVDGGLHATNFDLELSGQIAVGEDSFSSQTRKKDFLAPLPTIGVSGIYAFSPQLSVLGRVDYLSLTIDDYDGGLTNAQISLDYRAFNNVSFGIMYRYVDYDLDVDKPSWEGSFSYQYSGPVIYAKFAM